MPCLFCFSGRKGISLLCRKDPVPTRRALLTGRGRRLSLAPIGGEGQGEGAGFATQIHNAVLKLNSELILCTPDR